MKLTAALIIVLFVGTVSANAQSEYLKWKPLVINQKQRIWYDASSIDTSKGTKFDVWILQMHQPPLTFNEIHGKVYRSKTQYCVDLNSGKYGILRVVYYGVTNNVLYNFDYHIDNYPDNLKYTYPIVDNNFMSKLIKKLNKPTGKGTK